MNQTVLLAMLAYMSDLQRSIDLNETFAEDVLALLNEFGDEQGNGSAQKEMLDLARRHRVDAIKAHAKMEAITIEFIRRFGVERLAQEKTKYRSRRRSL